jgi:hypothetical protein
MWLVTIAESGTRAERAFGESSSELSRQRPTQLLPQSRELWLLFHRDIGRSPTVRAVIDRITTIAADAKSEFLADTA